MKKAAIGLLALGFFLAAIGTAAAATHTIRWSPVSTYTDGTTISGATITYAVYWSTSSAFTSPATLAAGLAGSSTTFDPAAIGMTAGSTVYFAMKTSLSTGVSSGYSTAYSWTVPSAAKTLSGIAINGASSVNEGATGAYSATATWSDGTTSTVTPAWSLSSTAYASISGAGMLTAGTVSANQTVFVNASYAAGSVTKTASKAVTIANVTATLNGITINGASSVNEGATGAYSATATWSDGTTSTVTPAWSLSSTAYASISGAGMLTAGIVSANQTVSVNASYAAGSVTRTASKAVTIANVTATLNGIAINGASSVNEGATGAYSATATWSDGTTSTVTPAWSLSSTAYASISGAGMLTAGIVSANQTVSVNASYAAGSVTKTASKAVTIANVDPGSPASPVNARIGKPATVPQDTWRLSWDAVTTYANGQELEAGSTVSYRVYWTRDPSLAADNLVLMTSASGTYLDFQPLSQGMADRERVYFLLRTVLGAGAQSALSEYLPWRVGNKEPTAPGKGKIGLKTRAAGN